MDVWIDGWMHTFHPIKPRLYAGFITVIRIHQGFNILVSQHCLKSCSSFLSISNLHGSHHLLPSTLPPHLLSTFLITHRTSGLIWLILFPSLSTITLHSFETTRWKKRNCAIKPQQIAQLANKSFQHKAGGSCFSKVFSWRASKCETKKSNSAALLALTWSRLVSVSLQTLRTQQTSTSQRWSWGWTSDLTQLAPTLKPNPLLCS